MSPEEAAWREAVAKAEQAAEAAKEAHLIAVYEECGVHWDAYYQAWDAWRAAENAVAATKAAAGVS